MKRSFPPPARQALALLAGALVCGAAACTPNHDVKPGAPELTELTIVHEGPTATTITKDTPECPAIATGDACLPMGKTADAADGGTLDADAPADSLCRLANATVMNWCTCVTDDPMTDPTKGTWNCDPFPGIVAVIAVFDRLLDTGPIDPGDAAGRNDLVMTPAGTPMLDLSTDYSATGDSKGLIFNGFGPFFGNFRADGPSLLTMAPPEFPSGATLTFKLNGDRVRAKDGKTVFVGSGLLMDGSITFMTAPFTVSVGAPDAKTLMMDPTSAVSVVFTNYIDAPGCQSPGDANPCTTAAAHITVTADGAPLAVKITSSDGGQFSVNVPAADGSNAPWPAGATIVVTVDGAVQDFLGETVAAGAAATFTGP
jgi:hypothetical protein